jgi:chemotaxis protein methyltransferase CheR
MLAQTETRDLTAGEYELFRKLIYKKSGIDLGNEKMPLLRSRLGKELRKGGFPSFRAYYEHVVQDETGSELSTLLDAVSTNTTHLFREEDHFSFLKTSIKRWLDDPTWYAENTTLRIWSAGCSSGEEPYSIAMVVHDALKSHPRIKAKILATDLSMQMLRRAKMGQFEAKCIGTVPAAYGKRYLHETPSNRGSVLQVAPELWELITFARFNLMTPMFPFQFGFHVIFCRNVMIYFDRPTQEALVGRYAKHLCPGGYLLIGHSENLNRIEHPLTYVEPTIYRKD